MGYSTYFNGTITLKDEKAIKLIRYLIKEEISPFSDFAGVITEDEGVLDINGDWKNYDDEIHKLCYFVKTLDKEAEGEVTCEGEDSFDIWKVVLNKKGVEVLDGEVIYKHQINYYDKKVEKEVKKLLSDKSITKKLILSELKT